MSKPMSYYEEKYVIRMKQKRQRNVQWDGINHVIVVCIVFLDIMSDLMIIKEKTFVWNANDSFKREMELPL